MIVGKTSLDKVLLKKIYREPDKVGEYSNSLIPKEFRHLKEIQDNQIYLVCMTLRKIGITDYKVVHSTVNVLLRGVRITGYVDELVEVEELYSIVNIERTKLFLERLK